MDAQRSLELDVLRRALVCLLVLSLALPVLAGREDQIKSAFVLNFLKFVEWPNEKDPVVLGVIGTDPVATELTRLESKTVRGKKVSVVKLTGPTEARGCAAVFVAESEAPQLQALLTTLKGQAVLTISDIPGFTEKGGGIGMITERNRVRFSINATAIEAAGLKASSRLLQLAVAVQ